MNPVSPVARWLWSGNVTGRASNQGWRDSPLSKVAMWVGLASILFEPIMPGMNAETMFWGNYYFHVVTPMSAFGRRQRSLI